MIRIRAKRFPWWPAFYIRGEWQRHVAGTAWGPLVLIREKYAEDVGIYMHECTHVAQWAATWALWALACWFIAPPDPAWAFYSAGALAFDFAYVVSDRVKLWAEVQAYRVQMRYPDSTGLHLSRKGAASRLASRTYGLGLSVDQALRYF